MINDALKKKLEKLSRLASDQGATEAERAEAERRLTALLIKHQIDASTVTAGEQYTYEEIETWDFSLPSTHSMHTRRSAGMAKIILALGAQCLSKPKAGFKGSDGERYAGNGTEALMIIANTSLMDMLKVLLPALLLQEMTAYKKFIAHYEENDSSYSAVGERWLTAVERYGEKSRITKMWKNQLNGLLRAARTGFLTGWYEEVANRLENATKDAVANAGDNHAALVLVTNKDRIKAVRDGQTTQTKAVSRSIRYHADAKGAGHAAGRQADIGYSRISSNGPRALG